MNKENKSFIRCKRENILLLIFNLANWIKYYFEMKNIVIEWKSENKALF